MHGNLKALPNVAVLGLFLANFVLCMHTNCRLPASNQNSDIAVRFRFSDPIS